MIEGVVNAAYEAVVTLILHGPGGRTREIEAVIDTGYNGFLTLPAALVAELRLPFLGPGAPLWPTEPWRPSTSTTPRSCGTAKCETSKSTPRAPLRWWVCCSWMGRT